MKAKAKELVDRFKPDTVIYTWDGDGYKIEEEESLGNAKNCALICVEELIKEQTMWQNGQTDKVLYWQDVRTEIEKL